MLNCTYLFLQQEVDDGSWHAIDALLPHEQRHHLLKVVHHSLHIVVGRRLFAARSNHVCCLLPMILEHLSWPTVTLGMLAPVQFNLSLPSSNPFYSPGLQQFFLQKTLPVPPFCSFTTIIGWHGIININWERGQGVCVCVCVCVCLWVCACMYAGGWGVIGWCRDG